MKCQGFMDPHIILQGPQTAALTAEPCSTDLVTIIGEDPGALDGEVVDPTRRPPCTFGPPTSGHLYKYPRGLKCYEYLQNASVVINLGRMERFGV